MRDYLEAVKACLRAFRGDEPLAHDGPYHKLSLLPATWAPRRHDPGDVKVDVSAVAPWMTNMAGSVAAGIHVHTFHSMPYLHAPIVPQFPARAAEAGSTSVDPT